MAGQPLAPTSDESLMAALSHFFGLLVAMVIWATQKDKSHFVRFQAVQAMVFDILVTAAAFLVVGCMMVFIFGTLALGVGDIVMISSQNNPTAEPIRVIISLMTAVPLLIPCIIIPLAGINFVARMIATIKTLQGKDFHYPWLGRLTQRYLEQRPKQPVAI